MLFLNMDFTTKIESVITDPLTTVQDIEQHCMFAIANNFAAVNVPALFIKTAKDFLKASPIKTVTMVGFPYGYTAIESKLAEVLLAMVDDVDELEMMVNITAIKNNDWQYIAKEISSIIQVTKARNKPLKVCIEAGLLTNEEIKKCCDIYGIAEVNGIITSSGFTEFTIAENVAFIRSCLNELIPVHAYCDGTFKQAKLFLEEGASRIISRNVAMLLHDYASLN